VSSYARAGRADPFRQPVGFIGFLGCVGCVVCGWFGPGIRRIGYRCRRSGLFSQSVRCLLFIVLRFRFPFQRALISAFSSLYNGTAMPSTGGWEPVQAISMYLIYGNSTHCQTTVTNRTHSHVFSSGAVTPCRAVQPGCGGVQQRTMPTPRGLRRLCHVSGRDPAGAGVPRRVLLDPWPPTLRTRRAIRTCTSSST